MNKVRYWNFLPLLSDYRLASGPSVLYDIAHFKWEIGRTPPPYRDPPDIFWTHGCSSWRGSPSLLQASGGWRAEPWSTEHDMLTFTPLSNLGTAVTLSKRKVTIKNLLIAHHETIAHFLFDEKPSIRSRLRIRIHDIRTERIRIQHAKMFEIRIWVMRFRMPNCAKTFKSSLILDHYFDH